MRNLGTINGQNLHLILSPSETKTVINALAFYSEALGKKYHGRDDFWNEWRLSAWDSQPEWADSLASRIASAAKAERIASGSELGGF